MDLEEKIEIMKEGGKIIVEVLRILKGESRAGKNGAELDKLAEELIYANQAQPAFKNYQPPFAQKTYPASVCLSINDVIVHGYPTKDTVLKDGDVVKLDLGIKYKKLFLDAAITIGVGKISAEAARLIETTKSALAQAIKAAKSGNTLGDVGWLIESTITDMGYHPIKNLCGHDIGEELHGELQVLNYGDPGTGVKIKPGMIFTIEPMASISSENGLQEDDFIFKTEDGSVAAHFEATIAITEKGNIILTPVLDIV